MMRRAAWTVVLGCLLSFVRAAVVITSPTASTVWHIGDTAPITWTASAGTADFTITIWPAGGGTGTILDQDALASDLVHNAQVGGNLPPGKWAIQFADKATNAFVARSSDFTIAAAAPITTTSAAAPSPSASIAITNPKAGVKWTQGNSYQITWDIVSGSPGDFTITIWPAGGGTGAILDSDTKPSDLSHTSLIAGNIPVGQWAIQFADKATNSFVARSPNFSVVAPTSTTSAAAPTSAAPTSASASDPPPTSAAPASPTSAAPTSASSAAPSPSSASSLSSPSASAPGTSSTPLIGGATATLGPSSTVSGSGSSPAASGDPAQANGGATQTPNPKSSNTGAIVGGVIGGLVLLGIAALVAFFVIRRRRRPMILPPSEQYNRDAQAGGYIGGYGAVPHSAESSPGLGGPMMRESGSGVGTLPSFPPSHEADMIPNRPYNYDDPSTWPPSLEAIQGQQPRYDGPYDRHGTALPEPM